ncbi:Protein tipE [Aphis craccivora]|uniref:Protein tipE n=1 Tax=Aphis craccivora TaxID=307492 RepID=A0A6G0ZJC0_APHCR|nr:Protein tipE [Aphis craccivora]
MAGTIPGDEKQVRSRQPSQDEGSRLLGEPAEDSFCQRIKPKVSLCLGTTAVLSFMVFLFLVPFVVDPAVSRLIARYSPEPGTCALHEHVFAAGMSKCTWSSCREGCTSATTKCHQITDHMSPESLEWAGTVVRFLVNTEGCGYPPFVNCTTFALKYGHINEEDIPEINHITQPVIRELYRHGNDTSLGTPPPPIRAYPDRVVADYDWHHTIKTLVAAVVIPWTLFVLSCTVLCYWYCPALKREFMVDKRKTAAIKNENPQLVIR